MKQKNQAAVELGRKGGEVCVPKGFSSLTPEQRKENAKRAAAARWGKKRKPRRAARARGPEGGR